MSYDIYLRDPVTKEVLHTEKKHDISGGTFELGGTNKMWLNVTYNYAEILYPLLDEELGIRVLYGKSGAESIPILKEAIGKLKDDVDVDEDYWKCTEGNVKRSLCGLLSLATMRPDGIFDGD